MRKVWNPEYPGKALAGPALVHAADVKFSEFFLFASCITVTMHVLQGSQVTEFLCNTSGFRAKGQRLLRV